MRLNETISCSFWCVNDEKIEWQFVGDMKSKAEILLVAFSSGARKKFGGPLYFELVEREK